jgi:hypothetical protein
MRRNLIHNPIKKFHLLKDFLIEIGIYNSIGYSLNKDATINFNDIFIDEKTLIKVLKVTKPTIKNWIKYKYINRFTIDIYPDSYFQRKRVFSVYNLLITFITMIKKISWERRNPIVQEKNIPWYLAKKISVGLPEQLDESDIDKFKADIVSSTSYIIY